MSDHKPSTRPPLTVYFTMVKLYDGTWFRAGRPYRTKEDAKEWKGFVSKAFGGAMTSVRSCTIEFDENRQPNKASAQRLDKEFNCEISFGKFKQKSMV